MEDPVNLLDDIALPEHDLDEYRRSYAIVRKLSIALAVLFFLVYSFAGEHEKADQYSFPYRLGTALGIALTTFFPAALIASVLAVFKNKKFTYKERFKKNFWYASLIMAVCLIFFFSIGTILEK